MHNYSFIKHSISVLTLFFLFQSSAQADLTLRQEAANDQPDKSTKPARFGYARKSDQDGAAITFALRYDFTLLSWDNSQLIPYAAISMDDNKSANKDKKSINLGMDGIIGDITIQPSFFVSSEANYSQDRIDNTRSIESTVSAEYISRNEIFRKGTGYTPNTWARFIRPSAGLYYLNTLETDDAIDAPKGNALGVSAILGFDLFTPFSSFTKITYQGQYNHDLSVSGNRNKDTYYKHIANITYYFYNPEAQVKNKSDNKLSIGLEYANGRDRLSTSLQKTETISAYLGVQF